MLTVKHITIADAESVYEVEGRVTFSSKEPQNTAAAAKELFPCVAFFTESGHERLTGGTVFVMNDHGKTVARYDLGASPIPHGVDGLTLGRSNPGLARPPV